MKNVDSNKSTYINYIVQDKEIASTSRCVYFLLFMIYLFFAFLTHIVAMWQAA